MRRQLVARGLYIQGAIVQFTVQRHQNCLLNWLTLFDHVECCGKHRDLAIYIEQLVGSTHEEDNTWMCRSRSVDFFKVGHIVRHNDQIAIEGMCSDLAIGEPPPHLLSFHIVDVLSNKAPLSCKDRESRAEAFVDEELRSGLGQSFEDASISTFLILRL